MGDIRAILSPLLLASYACGIRIIEFPAGKPRLWCSFLYMLLLWSIYELLCWFTQLHIIIEDILMMRIGFWMNNALALLSVVLGIYHDKKYRTCLRKIAMVDDTLQKIGIMQDHQKLYMKILFIVFGWCAYMICNICVNVLWNRIYYSAVNSFCVTYAFYHAFNIQILDDILIISTLGYIGHKFEQLNEYLRKLGGDNQHGIKRAWEHSMLSLRQTSHPKSMSNTEYATWIVIHLHLELCKISRMLNSIFGLQMTLKMGGYFFFMALSFRELFNVLLITNYVKEGNIFIILYTIFLFLNMLRLFIINYMCEKICIKANATGDIISRISYTTFDVVVRENITQFLLQIHLTPLKFYGLGLFTFGLKFFHGFSNSVTTVIVILIQSHTET